jgi:hypothetical protein
MPAPDLRSPLIPPGVGSDPHLLDLASQTQLFLQGLHAEHVRGGQGFWVMPGAARARLAATSTLSASKASWTLASATCRDMGLSSAHVSQHQEDLGGI